MKQKEIIYQLAKLLQQQNGSDIIINANSLVAMKINGKIKYLEDTLMTEAQTEALAQALVTEKQWKTFEAERELNFMLTFSDVAYFRTNIFRQRGQVGLVLRLIPLEIPSLEQLGLPELFKELALKKRGLVLFSGATGVGKSTSLAAMLDYRNQTYAEHFITIEDPIEFVHTNKRSLVTQREVGMDTLSFAAAMKSALRQAPDVILIGEIRDKAVMEQALAFAETGHTVFATVHATNATLTLERIVNLFSRERREQLLHDLSQNLQVIVSQRLIDKANDDGRVAALEVMTNTPHIKQLIKDSRLDEITEAMKNSTLKDGVITMDNYIFDLYEKGEISYESALQYVDSPHNFSIKLRSESTRALPLELTAREQNWDIEQPASSEQRQNVWGSFNKER